MSFVWSRCLVLFARIQSAVSWGSCMQYMSKGLFEVWQGHGDTTQSLMFTPACHRSLQRHFGLLWHCFQIIIMEKQADPITMRYLIQLAYLYQNKTIEASDEIQMTPPTLSSCHFQGQSGSASVRASQIFSILAYAAKLITKCRGGRKKDLFPTGTFCVSAMMCLHQMCSDKHCQLHSFLINGAH